MSADFLECFFRRVWVEGDPAAIDALFATGARARGFAPDLAAGPEDFHVLVPALRRLVRDIAISVEHGVTEGDWTSALVRVAGTSASSGAPVAMAGQVMARISDGRVVEAYNHFDWISFFEALDLLPPQTMAMCLAGQPPVG